MREPEITVGVLSEKELNFSFPETFICQEQSIRGKQTATYVDGKILFRETLYDELLFIPQNSVTAFFELQNVTIGINFHWERKENQRFRGALKIIIENEALTAINIIPVEEYLTSVISSEMSATASLELLKAHAVISRSWLLKSLTPTLSKGEGERDRKEFYQTADGYNYGCLREKQRELKLHPTEAETVMWKYLRNKQLGVNFRRQHIIQDDIVDFVCLEKKIVIEIDRGYHTPQEQQTKDNERSHHLHQLGFTVIRFTNAEVIASTDHVVKTILASLSFGESRDESFIRWYDREAHTHFHVCADDHCQRYQGITRTSTTKAMEAISATRGQVLTYEGKICDARFSKCCGGAFEEFQNCWENVPHSYLIRQRDSQTDTTLPDLRIETEAQQWIRTSPSAFCNTQEKKVLSQVLNNYDQETADFYRWKVTYEQKELSELIQQRSGIDFGQILDLIPIERGTSGRLVQLKIVGSKRSLIIGKELEIRRTLSTSHLYSSAFVIDKEGNDNGIPQRFILTGAGWGHGVGLCQIGAAVMGEQGCKYDEILSHYYPHTILEKQYE